MIHAHELMGHSYERELGLVDGIHNLSIRTTVLRTHNWLVHAPPLGGGQE